MPSSHNLYIRFLEQATEHPRRKALLFESNTWRYADVRRLIHAQATQLRTAGLKPGQRAAILLKNSPAYVFNLFAIWACGAAAVPINHFLKSAEIDFILKDGGATLLITDSEFRETTDALAAPARKFYIDQLPEEGERVFSVDVRNDPNELAVVIYTSGTTGQPKGACLTHGNLIANVESCEDALGVKSNSDRILIILPMFHSFMMTVGILTPLLTGFGIVLVTSLKPFSNVIQEMIRKRVTILPAIPQIYQALANASIPWYIHWLLPLRLAISGAAPLPAETVERFNKKFRIKLLEGYGLSEASPVVTFNPLRGVQKTGSCGLPVKNVEVSIRDGKGRVLPAGEVGEVCVRGPNVMSGYLNRADETAKTIRDGWLHTGDLGKMETDGYLYIVDRLKDMLLVHGMNVYPREIEEVIHRFPGVKECAVVGRADTSKGETPVAFFAEEEGKSVDLKALREYCRANLADYKCPREFHTVPALPRNPAGKILKNDLRALALRKPGPSLATSSF